LNYQVLNHLCTLTQSDLSKPNLKENWQLCWQMSALWQCDQMYCEKSCPILSPNCPNVSYLNKNSYPRK
jgi:hypothetical protein